MKSGFSKGLVSIALMVGLAASLGGCQWLADVAETARDDVQAIRQLKQRGCDQLSPTEKKILVRIAKSYTTNYPDDGICDREWVRKVLFNQVMTRLPVGLNDAEQQPVPD